MCCCLAYTSTSSSSSLIRGWWLSASVSTGPSAVSDKLRPGKTKSLQTWVGTTVNTAPTRHASIYQLLLEKQAGRRRRPPLRRTAPPTSPGRRTAHGHTKYVSVFDERIRSVCVCVHLTSYPYFSTLEARNAPRMLPTGAQALHRPNTKPRLGEKENLTFSVETAKKAMEMSSIPPSRFYI